MVPVGRCARPQESDGRQRFALLRARSERPCCRCAAKKRNEIPPSQLIEAHLLPLARVAAYRIGPNQVRGSLQCGLLTRLLTGLGSGAPQLVRARQSPMSAMPPIATKAVTRSELPLSATSRPEQVQQTEQAYGRLQMDYKFVFRRRLHWTIGRTVAAQDLSLGY